MLGFLIAAITVIVVVVALVLGFGVILARKAATWTIRRDERVLSCDGELITLVKTPESAHRGEFTVHFDGGSALVGEKLIESHKTVTRRVLRVVGDRDAFTRVRTVRWEGETHIDPREAGPYAGVVVDSPAGSCPAWFYPGSASRDAHSTWAIHIHGIRADRHNAVRSVSAASNAGMASLVVSYRGDGEGPAVRGGAASLGMTEWVDIDSAVAYALEQGAKRVVLIGWSMGASIALQVSEKSTHRDAIVRLVLISPASDWREIILHGARQRGLPTVAARLGHLMLSNRVLSRVAGLAAPADLESLDWTVPNRLSVPTLVVHSRGDRTVPFEVTEKFARAGGKHVTLFEVDGADHSWEFNVDPENFTKQVSTWLTELGSDFVVP